MGYSAAFHLVAFLLVTVSLSFDAVITPPASAPPQIIEAVAVDARKVEAEVERLRAADAAKSAEQERLARQAEQARKQVEALKKEQERLAREKVSQEKALKEAEVKRKAEEVRRKAEDDKKKREAEAERKAQEEKKRAEEARLKAAEQKKRAEAERRQRELNEALAAEEKARTDAEQAARDQSLLGEAVARIQARIESVFINPSPERDLKCTIFVRMVPGGEVIEARVTQSSGDAAFDRQAEIAVQKASPLPVPADAAVFDRLRLRQIQFVFDPTD
ncbi:MAG: cell envelope integrity protein TolA [Gammaproteobacteria bacterium]|nr:cell envelope integrity protein TolA [Gammaproteobacteria bacterium]